MANSNHLTKEQRLYRDSRIWDLRVKKNKTQDAIAKELQTTQKTVSKVLERLNFAYYQAFIHRIDIVKQEQVAQLEIVAQNAWRAWEKSKKKHVTSTDSVGGESGGFNSVTTSDQYGDPRFLTVYLKAKEDIRKILGIDAATKVHITTTDNKTPTIGFLDRLYALTTQGTNSGNS